MLSMIPAVCQDSSVTKHWDNHKSFINPIKFLSCIQFWVNMHLIQPPMLYKFD